ncbi:hypothetical protein SAMN04488527_11074 [Aliiroseovarius crassostreae]|uniref:DUF6626 family protein n=1 Tax=Aliiroseovarius crassostreae TaxID=154981 RepID=UPI0008F3CA5A|nr:DUF6626 family protein [Aliiroseovarius crassostreae]SFU67746.1 hypothetical protein SAMN04488527_11074 [Aliiroseovarius crassostreae]
MLLMESIYKKLKAESLVENAEAFSQKWCNRSRSWYAVQKCSNSDLSVQAAVACLRRSQARLIISHLQRKRLGSAIDAEIETLRDVISCLEAHLRDKHCILSVVPVEVRKPKML